MAAKVFVTRAIPESGLELLRREIGEFDMNPEDRSLTKSELIEQVKNREGILCLLTDPIDADVIAAAEKCRAIANYAVGYNNIDVNAATARNIVVTNTPGVLTDATADLAWALLMAAARKIVPGDSFTRDGKFTGWAPLLFLGMDIVGKTLGIIGPGRIGTAMAMRSRGFDMNVLYAGGSTPNERIERELNGRRVELDDLLRESDFVSLHVPLTDKTRHLLGERELSLMKKTAVLINTSRGPVIDESALVKALQKNELFAAGLDVFEEEPKLAPGMAELENVVVAPHVGSATHATRSKMAEMAASDLVAVLKGNRPQNCVNPQVFE